MSHGTSTAPTARRALVLSASTGAGHDSLAAACSHLLRLGGVEPTTVDTTELLGTNGPAAAADWVFRKLLSRPAVYDALHFDQLRPYGRLARAMGRASTARVWPNLLAAATDLDPELVLAVCATGAAPAARWKARHPDTAAVVLNGDQVAHGLWVPDGIDLFLVTSSAAAAWVRRFSPAAAVRVVDHPVRPAFHDPPARADARRALGVPDDAPCALLMAGGWGLAPLADMADALAAAGVVVLAVAGQNRDLAGRLRAVAAGRSGVVAFGHTDRVPELMAACDVVVTTSGATCAEARTVGRGLVLLDLVPGHGRENLQHQLELGHAVVSGPGPAEVARAVRAFLDDPAHDLGPDPARARRWEGQLAGALSSVGVALRLPDGPPAR